MVFSIGGGQICSRHRYGGQNPYFSTKSQYYHCSFCPRGGPNSIANFDAGAMAGFAPLDPPLFIYIYIYKYIIFIYIYNLYMYRPIYTIIQGRINHCTICTMAGGPTVGGPRGHIARFFAII